MLILQVNLQNTIFSLPQIYNTAVMRGVISRQFLKIQMFPDIATSLFYVCKNKKFRSFKGIGLQRLCLTSEDGGWRD